MNTIDLYQPDCMDGSVPVKGIIGILIRTPLPGANYETIAVSVEEDLLPRVVVKEGLETDRKFIGPPALPCRRAYRT